jgi:hypothetical protein
MLLRRRGNGWESVCNVADSVAVLHARAFTFPLQFA